MVTSILFALAVTAASPKAAAPQAPVSVEVRVTDRQGHAVRSAHVKIDGGAVREGHTSPSGRIAFRGLKPGRHLVRVEHDSFVALEKEFFVSADHPAVVVAAMTPDRAGEVGVVGSPRVLSIPDLAEHDLIKREAVKESALGCSGNADAHLIQLREPLIAHVHQDADEILYVVAGQGILELGDARQKISPGWFSLVPRGTVHSLTRQGKNPLIVLSLLSGEPCTPRQAGLLP
jgi:mannose-6-phosphate isomerase-like protein (cupin superfamily)